MTFDTVSVNDIRHNEQVLMASDIVSDNNFWYSESVNYFWHSDWMYLTSVIVSVNDFWHSKRVYMTYDTMSVNEF